MVRCGNGVHADLRSHGGHDGGGLSDGTVHRIHGVLRRALTQAVRWEWVWTNPAEHACPTVARRREIFSPPPHAVAKLLSWMPIAASRASSASS